MEYKILNGFQKWNRTLDREEVRLRRTRIKVDRQVIYPAFRARCPAFGKLLQCITQDVLICASS